MDVEARVISVVARVLKIKAQEVAPTASLGTFPEWDSLNHTNVIIELESEFDIAFEFDELDKVVSIRTIVEAVKKKI